MSNVSKENLRKVERFFIEQIKFSGNSRIKSRVNDIADGSGVALATAHKAIKELEKRGLLNIIKPSSRRFPITYVYCGDIEEFKTVITQEDQIAYLMKRVAELEEENKILKRGNRLS